MGGRPLASLLYNLPPTLPTCELWLPPLGIPTLGDLDMESLGSYRLAFPRTADLYAIVMCQEKGRGRNWVRLGDVDAYFSSGKTCSRTSASRQPIERIPTFTAGRLADLSREEVRWRSIPGVFPR